MSSAAFAYPQKSAEAFRTISEVAVELDVPQHVLRFWESRFTQIKPVKRAGGRRYYRPEDIDLLKGIRVLLYNDGLTIRGVQKVLKERGLRHVADLGRGQVAVIAPQVIEKIIYVEKAVAVPKKPRAPHLRAVPDTMDLPFFADQVPAKDQLAVQSNCLSGTKCVPGLEMDTSPNEVPVFSEKAEKVTLLDHDRQRLDELLDELIGLKARLQEARERFQK